jgi:hypothetical protein
VIWSRLWPFLAGGLIGVPIGTALLGFVAGAAAQGRRRPAADLYCAWMAFVRRPPV